MAKNRQSIRVIIYRTKHKSQPYRVDIDGVGPGPMDTLMERYARPFTARRGALRHLKAEKDHVIGGWWIGDRRVEFEQVGK